MSSFLNQTNKLQFYFDSSQSQNNGIERLKRKQLALLSENFHKVKTTITVFENYRYVTSDWTYGIFVYEKKFENLKEWMLSSLFLNFYVTGQPAPGFQVSNLAYSPNFNYLWKQEKVEDSDEDIYLLKVSYSGQLATSSPTATWPLYLNLKIITYNPLIRYAISNNKT